MQADRGFTDILARVRSGACTAEDLRELGATCSRPLDLSDGILPTMVLCASHLLCTMALVYLHDCSICEDVTTIYGEA